MSNELYARIALLEGRIATLEAAVRDLAAMTVRLDARVRELESRRGFIDIPVGSASGLSVVAVHPIRYEVDKVPPEPKPKDFLRPLEFDD